MRVRLLISCGAGRFDHGEIGEVLKNDSEKYQYRVQLPDRGEVIDNPASMLHGLKPARIFYFFKDEVEVLQ